MHCNFERYQLCFRSRRDWRRRWNWKLVQFCKFWRLWWGIISRWLYEVSIAAGWTSLDGCSWANLGHFLPWRMNDSGSVPPQEWMNSAAPTLVYDLPYLVLKTTHIGGHEFMDVQGACATLDWLQRCGMCVVRWTDQLRCANTLLPMAPTAQETMSWWLYLLAWDSI